MAMTQKEKINRIDFVDNQIMELLHDVTQKDGCDVLPEWDIEIIGRVRDVIAEIVEEYVPDQWTTEDFYPSL